MWNKVIDSGQGLIFKVCHVVDMFLFNVLMQVNIWKSIICFHTSHPNTFMSRRMKLYFDENLVRVQNMVDLAVSTTHTKGKDNLLILCPCWILKAIRNLCSKSIQSPLLIDLWAVNCYILMMFLLEGKGSKLVVILFIVPIRLYGGKKIVSS